MSLITNNINEELNKIKEIILLSLPFSQENFGKMIRSQIGILILKAHDIIPKKEHYSILAATELVHTASLLHDDVIDNNDIRRNQKNIKNIIGNKASILMGNITLTKGVEKLLSINSTNIMTLFNDTIMNMNKGELLQYSMQDKIPTIEEYITKTQLKTAILFETMIKSLKIISPQIIENTPLYGLNYGIGFQIKNDLEDFKTTKNDILNGVYTAPYIYTKKYNEKIGIEKTISLIDNYTKKAIKSVEDLKEGQYKETLIGVTECLKK